MLKFERTSHQHDVSVTFRDKEHFFTRSLLIALAAAIGIHLSLILLFHISPLKIRWSNAPSLPSIVETDLALNGDALVIANLNPAALPDNILLRAPLPLPLLLDTPLHSSMRHLEYIEKSQADNNLFDEVEKEIYLPIFTPTKPFSAGPISVHISGLLANKILNTSIPMQNWDLSQFNIHSPQNLMYFVLMDGQTGKIFWQELLQPSNNRALEKFASSVVEKLGFVGNPSEFVTAGHIEVRFVEVEGQKI